MAQRWEYCLLACTPMSGLDEGGIRLSCQLAGPDRTKQVEIRSVETSPLAAIGQLFNELGNEGWEMVTYDTTSHRGVFKRLKT